MVDDNQPSDPGDQASAHVEQLLALALDRFEQQGPIALESFLAEHPEHADRLRSYFSRLGRLGLLDDDGESGDAAHRATVRDFPESLGDFRLLERLGAGGMGVVYLAEQRSLARQVALKIIRPEHLFFPGARDRFRREVEAIARLQHPGIVPVHATGEDAGVPWLAMEYVGGASLGELIVQLAGSDPGKLRGADLRAALRELLREREGDEAPATTTSQTSSAVNSMFVGSWASLCTRLVRSVAEALQHAHERGVLHRDVKPSNIMLTSDGRAQLLDFGLAQAEGAERLTTSGGQLGSPAYMSPEQVRGQVDRIDARTDVYSLGVTFYELLTLHAPFLGESPERTRELVLAGRAVAPRTHNPAIPSDAERVCLKAMDLDPARRYVSVAAFADDLGNLLELRPVTAQRQSTVIAMRRWAQRHPARAIAAIAAFLILLVAPTLFWVQQRAANTRIAEALTRARADRARAHEAVDVMLTRVAWEERLDPLLRRDLLVRARAINERFLADSAGQPDPAEEEEVARSALRLAKLDFELGRADAGAAAARAVELARRMLARLPQVRSVRVLLTQALDTQGKVKVGLGDHVGALGDLDEVRSMQRVLAEQEPDDLDLRLEHFGTDQARAFLLSQLGELDPAVAAYRELAELGAQLLQRAPAGQQGRDGFARVFSATADEAAYLLRIGRPEQAQLAVERGEASAASMDFGEMPATVWLARARLRQVRARLSVDDQVVMERHLRAALSDIEHLLADNPAKANALRIEASILQDIALIAGQSVARSGEAQQLTTRSIATLRRLLELDPGFVEIRASLAASLANLGAAQLYGSEAGGEVSRELLIAAHAAFTEAEELARAACEAVPSRQDWQLYRYNATWFLAQACCSLGDHAGEAAAAMRLAELRPDDAQTQRIVGELLAEALALVAMDDDLPAAMRTTRQGELEAAAIQRLREAARLGYADAGYLRSAETFVPLRRLPGFREVLAMVVANAKSASGR